MEADHLGGDTDMVSVVETVLEEQKRRLDAGKVDGAFRSALITDTSCWTISARKVSLDIPRLGG